MPSAESDGGGPGQFSQAGSITRLKFRNFMQYSDTEFKCGPNLNVIIGPNGSGKSTIVNGICLGLAGKTSVLGRASNIQDFIKVGEKDASVEVELFNPEGDNVTICREWDQSGKTRWTVGGRKVGVKEVEKLVASYRIQVDNLCQFLPQDKVHDFSRLNSKGLLDSTVEAVGDPSLKEKHQELKDLQKNLSEGEELFERKRQMLQEKTTQCRRLEEDVKAFHDKKKLEEKVVLLEGRLVWSKVSEVKSQTKEKQKSTQQAKKCLEEQEEKLKPLKDVLAKVKKRKIQLDSKVEAGNGKIKESMMKAKTHSQNIEKLEENLSAVDEELEEIERREREKQTEIQTLQTRIAEMEAEFDSTEDDGSLGPQLVAARRETEEVQGQLAKLQRERDGVRYEKVTLENKVKEGQSMISELNNVDKQKLEVLRNRSKDAYEAALWLRNNRDLFTGEVHEPFIVCGNVSEPSNALYLENAIAMRDLTAFFFENKDDMNLFLNTSKDRNLGRVSAVQVPDVPAASFHPNVPDTQLAQFGFVSYLREMVEAPDSVMAYMCRNHNLHNVAVFKPSAEKFNDRLINEIGLTKFFFGPKLQSVSGSRYSAVKTTMTREVQAHMTLQISKDSGREGQVKREIQQMQQKLEQLDISFSSLNNQLSETKVQQEAALQHRKKLEQKKNFRQTQTGRIEAQKKILRQKMAVTGMEREKGDQEVKRRGLVGQMVKSVVQLQVAIREVHQASLKKELSRIESQPLEELADEKQEALETAKESLKEFQRDLDLKTQELEDSKAGLLAALKEARLTISPSCKTTEPPNDLVDKWKTEQLPVGREEIEVMTDELRAQADCMDTVDPRIVKDYLGLKETISELQQDIDRREQGITDSAARMQEVKEAWLSSLNRLVERINTRFSAHFASMGFAGEVGLHTGQHENDFENFGVKIRVKYRDSEPLKELSAHHQSGGERSVATALYMLALQELTTVPFRCVDEINQGMDATNERRVFQLLVRTSCHETSAQYFLLTPKLLPGLEYSPRMSLLVVNNGPSMLHHTEWDMEAFHRHAARAQ